MNFDHPIFNRYPELKELIKAFRNELQQLQRPANEVVLNDQDVMRMLKISKRKLEYLKAAREIPYSQPKERSACYYLLSDVLQWIESSRVESLTTKFSSK